MSKVVFFSTTFYPEMIEWNPLGMEMEDDWKEYERDWKTLGKPLNPLTGDPHYTKGQVIVTEQNQYKSKRNDKSTTKSKQNKANHRTNTKQTR